MKSLSKDNKILFYFFLILLVICLIFDTLKYSWADDPFQKVVLAPLGEEPFKILFALMFVIYSLFIMRLITRSKKDLSTKIKFLEFFYYTFIPFAILSAIFFGLLEGPLFNILLHFSTTTIAAILILTIFQKIKDRDMKTFCKVLIVFSSMMLPMLLHSISNQYMNIIYADNHPEFEYLVVIGRFFESHSFFVEYYVLSLFIITCILLWVFVYKYYISKINRVMKI